NRFVLQNVDRRFRREREVVFGASSHLEDHGLTHSILLVVDWLQENIDVIFVFRDDRKLFNGLIVFSGDRTPTDEQIDGQWSGQRQWLIAQGIFPRHSEGAGR